MRVTNNNNKSMDGWMDRYAAPSLSSNMKKKKRNIDKSFIYADLIWAFTLHVLNSHRGVRYP